MIDTGRLGAVVSEVVEEYFAARNRGKSPAAGFVPAACLPVYDRPVPSAGILPPPECKAGENQGFPTKAERQTIEVLNPELLQRMKNSTSARIGVGRTGPRLRTSTLLKLRSDHAAARDAVFRDVSPELLERLGMPVVQSRCSSRQEHITRPDLGRRFSEEAVKTVTLHCEKGRDVQVIASDGLSSRAIEANLENLYLVLAGGLKGKNISMGNPFFVRFGRVAVEDEAAELLKARLVCILIGERPGLAAAESMSAYLCYEARVGQPESRRTVVSNIHANGIPAVEAGAYLVDLIEKILQNKASGVEFKR
ncbi:MAG: ethanolamine ammonia-lyase subunit EutC [Treponema sp.]|jgi:ethanolamine ammonia-lyase small subunit|nr:ethanolamine ammonia-lyase subunit EutC [Treponema sp.]